MARTTASGKHLQAEECSPRCDLSRRPEEDEVEDDEKEELRKGKSMFQ